MDLLLMSLFVFVINLPFGYWRANVRKYGLQWMLAVHIPVFLVIAARIYSNIGFDIYTYPIVIGAFIIGQLLGKYLYSIRKDLGLSPVTSCLFMDLVRSN